MIDGMRGVLYRDDSQKHIKEIVIFESDEVGDPHIVITIELLNPVEPPITVKGRG